MSGARGVASVKNRTRRHCTRVDYLNKCVYSNEARSTKNMRWQGICSARDAPQLPVFIIEILLVDVNADDPIPSKCM